MPRRSRAAVLLSLLLVAACTDEAPDEEAASSAATSSSSAPSSSAPSSSASASATATSGGPASPSAPNPTDEQLPDGGSFPADTADDGGPAQEGADGTSSGLRVAGLRFNGHDGFSRLVVDLSGSGVPEWTVGYSEATGPGGGPVDIAGDAFLRVSLRTGTAPSGQSTSRVRVSPGPVVEAMTTGFFEGQEEVLIGVRGGEQPFRAFALTDPGRIVVDVRPG